MDALIEAEGLHKAFGATHAVVGVSLQVAAGEAYGLVGPDGAGKTTVLRLLVGAIGPDAGSVRVAGHDVVTRPERARAHIGYLAQRFSLYADLTVLENLAFFGEVRGVAPAQRRERAAELLRFVGLAGFEQRLAGQLSGGMKQKLGLACALIHQPAVLLLDEPTGGVDPLTRQDFWQLIIRLLAQGTAVVVSTPYMDEAVRCTRVGFLYSGRILCEGPPRSLAARLDDRILELVAHPLHQARQVCLRHSEIADALPFGERLHVRLQANSPVTGSDAAARLGAVLTAEGVRVERLRPITPGLEDLFLALLQEARS